MNRRFQDARNFVAADWQNIKIESREKLLMRDGLNMGMARMRWWKLPETVKNRLVESFMEAGKYARV